MLIQAENMLLSGFNVYQTSAASGGAWIQAAGTAEATASTVFQEEDAIYTIKVRYFDENDGVSHMSLKVNGSIVASWDWNQDLGSSTAWSQTAVIKSFDNILLREGSTIELVGTASSGEPLRTDYIELVKTAEAPAKPQAFDGVEGYGAESLGGRGGQVVHVTNLNDSGVGSLRWALQDVDGPRIVVFDVEGQIKLKDQITVSDPFVTIAGQTAPGDGIVVSGARISIQTHDVIMRGMKIRPGDALDGDAGSDRDSVSIGNGDSDQVYNIVLDGNSFTWSVDENVAVWGTAKNITISNNIIAEALQDSIHIDEGKTTYGPHSMGLIVGRQEGHDGADSITISKNLLVSNEYRNAFIKQGANIEFINNYIFNYGAGHQGGQIGGSEGTVSVNIIGNVYEDGKNTTSGSGRTAIDVRGLVSGSSVYVYDNYVDGHRELTTDSQLKAVHDLNPDGTSTGTLYMVTTTPVIDGSDTDILSSAEVKAYVLSNAGARLYTDGLDAVDQRIVNGVIAGTSSIIDSQNQVGGYGVYNFTGQTVKDTDKDGIADWFEIQYASYGFKVNVADDKLDYDGDGYTNIEEYINGLIDGFKLGATTSGTVVTPSDPVVTPSDPVVTPSDPVVTPSDPVVTPSDPVVTPSDPVVEAEDPVIGLPLSGEQSNTVLGTSSKETLTGDNNNNTLNGGGGDDTLVGGKGDDMYIVLDAEKVVEKTGQGVDTVISKALSYTLVSNVENLYIQESYNQRGTGNTLANVIIGGNATNIIDGKTGDDWLVGGGGSDIFIYGKSYGNDVIADFDVNSDKVQLIGMSMDSSTLQKSLHQDGNDAVFSLAGYTLTFKDVQASSLNLSNIIAGVTKGGAENNTYYALSGTENISDSSSTDTDVLYTYASSYTMGLNVENAYMMGAFNNDVQKLAGNVLANIIHGSAGDDSISADAGNDVLYGNGGNDILYGGTGDDTLNGGAGNDYLYGWSGADTFAFTGDLALAGVDTIEDFKTSQGDKIDISDLLQGYNLLTSAIEDFVRFSKSGSSSILEIDANGGRDNFTQIAILKNTAGLDAQALLDSGHLVV